MTSTFSVLKIIRMTDSTSQPTQVDLQPKIPRERQVFFVRRGMNVIGPLTVDQLQHVIRTGQIGGDCGVSKTERGPWKLVKDVRQLAGLLPDAVQVHSTKTTSDRSAKPQLATVQNASPKAGRDEGPIEAELVRPPDKWMEQQSTSIDETAQTPESQRSAGRKVFEDLAAFGAKLTSELTQRTGSVVRSGRERMSTAYEEAMSSVDETESIAIDGKVVFGRQDAKVDVLLSHPQVSRTHTMLQRVGQTVYVSDLGSEAGTFVDGNPIQSKTELQPGQELSIGPYQYKWDGVRLATLAVVDSTELLCRKLTRIVTDRSTKQPITILNEVSLVAKPREFLVLLGPSGSGKSTLLSALAARVLATSGDIALNGRNLYANFDSLKRSIAMIPQKDVLHDQLKLRRALEYTARLRLPPDLTGKEVREIINRLLKIVELDERSQTPISALSGGQIKRASVANELMANPGLIFVDEATSGLDEHTDGELMRLFRKLAEDGKTIICVTHNLTNVERFCHRVAVLAPGGHLAFVGTPDDAKRYFDIASLGDVYLRLRDKSGADWQAQFEQTNAYKELSTHVEEVVGPQRPELATRKKPTQLQQLGIFVRQTGLLLRRGVEIHVADRNNLLMTLGQCVMVAILIVILFGRVAFDEGGGTYADFVSNRSILFLMTISAFWFGCNNAAKEVVKERSIYQREQSVNLNIGSYFASKFLLLGTLTSLQIGILFLSVTFATGLMGNPLLYGFSLWLTGVAGVLLGMTVSCYASSENVAVTTVPLVVIPQVILAGLIGELAGLSKFIAAIFVTCFWGFGSLNASLPDELQYFVPESIETESYVFSLVAIGFHGVLLFALGLGRLYAVSKNWSLPRQDLERWMRSTAAVLAEQTSVFTQPENASPIKTRLEG